MKKSWAIALGVVVTGIAAVAVVRGSAQPRRPVPSAQALQQLERGAHVADSTLALIANAPAESVRTADAVTATYLERVRLGIGSPFRVIEHALRDPMLPPERQRDVAYAILAVAFAGKSHQGDARAVALMQRRGGADAQAGARHVALIDSVFSNTADPHVAELSLRLAYRLASASGSVSRRAPAIAVQAAALARDRVLAERDTRRLLDAARRQQMDPLELMADWRSTRRFDVERPVLNAIGAAAEQKAVTMLPKLVDRIEQVAKGVEVAGPSADAEAPMIGEGGARRMAGLVVMRNSPPQAPVGVTIGGFARAMSRLSGTRREREARARFIARAVNEEALAAEYALLRARSSEQASEAALAVLTSAVAMRAYAQERAWMMGDDGPSIIALQARLGLSEVRFDAQVPASWRPYYLNMLEDAIADVRRVLPDFDPVGLRVHFGAERLASRALALHNPGTRTVHLPIMTSAGAIAHELAHDLDLQAGIKHYGVRGVYRTDHAVRQDGDKLGASVRRLASMQASAPLRGVALASSRPTEVFARTVDWFVSASLAHEGRMNGYLTAVQDAAVTGYASTSSPGVSPVALEQMLQVLSEVTTLPAATRDWLERTHGANTGGVAMEILRRVLEAPLTWDQLRASRPAEAIDASTRLLLASDAALGAWACTEAGATGASLGMMRPLIEEAAQARARGVIQRWTAWAREHADLPVRLRTLGSGPWDPGQSETLQQQVEDAVLMRVSSEALARQPFWAIAAGNDGSDCPSIAR